MSVCRDVCLHKSHRLAHNPHKATLEHMKEGFGQVCRQPTNSDAFAVKQVGPSNKLESHQLLLSNFGRCGDSMPLTSLGSELRDSVNSSTTTGSCIWPAHQSNVMASPLRATLNILASPLQATLSFLQRPRFLLVSPVNVASSMRVFQK